MNAQRKRELLRFLSALNSILQNSVRITKDAVTKRCNSYYIKRRIEHYKDKLRKLGYWLSDKIALLIISTLTILGILAREFLDWAERR